MQVQSVYVSFHDDAFNSHGFPARVVACSLLILRSLQGVKEAQPASPGVEGMDKNGCWPHSCAEQHHHHSGQQHLRQHAG